MGFNESWMVTILLIEDDNCLRENTQEILDLAGYKTIVAADGPKGVKLALAGGIDLILCDIIMPGLDGYSVLKQLSSVLKTRKIPFIFLTAKSDLKEIRKGMNLGADDYIAKPFEEEELLETINSRLAKNILLKKGNSTTSDKPIAINNIKDFKEYFLKNGEIIKVPKGQILFSENQFARYVYLLEMGLIKTFNIDEFGKEFITGIYRTENFLGLYSFNGRLSYPEFARGIEASKLYRLPLDYVQSVFNANPDLTMEWAQHLSEDVIDLKKHLLQTAYASVLRKTANTLLDFSENMKLGKVKITKISRGNLANIAGISKESFIRCLSILKNDGVISVQGRNIEILNLNELKKIK